MADKKDIHDRRKKKNFVNVVPAWINLEKLSRILWGLVLLTLPVTSFRYFPFLGKHTYVRPLAFYPLALLFLVLLLRLWRKEIKLPWSNPLLPLLFFLFALLFTTGAGALLSPIPMRGHEYWGRALRAFITFGIGLSFFIAALWMHKDKDDLRHSLKWLYAGLFLTMLWAGVQALAFYTPLLTKSQVSEWQLLFSMRGIPKLRRVSGFAFEASWLAGQIVTLYLPWLVASLLLRFRATKYNWLEPLLLLGTLATLFLTYSRGGLLIGIVATGLTLLISGRRAILRVFKWFFNHQDAESAKSFSETPRTKSSRPLKKTWRTSGLGGSSLYSIGVRVIIVILVVAVVWGGISFLAGQNYVNRLWKVEATSISDYFVKTNAGGRFTYLWAETQLFLDYPILGTGLGSSGLYLFDYFPDWALYNNPEITKQLTPTSQLYPNSKNLYLRLLAETGIFGFTIFLSFLLAILAEIAKSLRQNKLIGTAGLFSFIAILTYDLMQDSFAMAELWVNFGIILGITSISPPSSSPRKWGENSSSPVKRGRAGGGLEEHL
ncbi:MAG: hypothetical protein GY755_16585 [Chloroflexi bacterium]|nr:hypothetical protein [Chloroflexota bacterium]